MIDKSKYSVTDIKRVSGEELQEKGYIFVPYICVEHTKESLSEYDKFIIEYHKSHKYCPKCESSEYRTTLLEYILNWDKKDEYKDMNRCTCIQCGYIHHTHDRVNIK